jgi:hypothetical protein
METHGVSHFQNTLLVTSQGKIQGVVTPTEKNNSNKKIILREKGGSVRHYVWVALSISLGFPAVASSFPYQGYTIFYFLKYLLLLP